MNMDDMKEPFYTVSSYSSGFKVVKFSIVMLALAATLGACLLTAPLPLLRFILGLLCTGAILFVAYNQGVYAGAAAMMAHLQAKARDVSAAMSLMEETLRKKNEDQ